MRALGICAGVFLGIMTDWGQQMRWGRWRKDLEIARIEQRNKEMYGKDTKGDKITDIAEWTVGDIRPLSGEVMISPYGTEERITAFFQDTKYRLRMGYYRLDHTKIRNILCALRHKWVSVQLIHESFPYESYASNTIDKKFLSLQKYLTACGVQVRSDDHLPTSYLHEKVALADEAYLLSTSNLTYTSFRKNREFWVIGHDREVFASLDYMLQADRSWAVIPEKTVHPNLLICPLTCRERVEKLIESAKSEIVIAAQYVQDEWIIERLKIFAEKQGSRLQILVSPNQAKGRLDDLAPYVRILPAPYLHAKVLLVDQTYMLVGSMNFSTQAIENNREVSIILTDKANIRRFVGQFEKDRAASK